MPIETAVAVGATNDSDAALVNAIRLGETDKYEELMNRHRARIFRLACRITGKSEDAEEVAQDAFVLAYRHLPDFRGDTSSFYSWLAAITVNQSMTKMRKRRFRTVSLEWTPSADDEPRPLEIADPAPTPEERQMQRETSEIVARAVAALQPRFRCAVELYYGEEKHTEEMAKVLDLHIETVKTHLHRARIKLREALKGLLRNRPRTAPWREALVN